MEEQEEQKRCCGANEDEITIWKKTYNKQFLIYIAFASTIIFLLVVYIPCDILFDNSMQHQQSGGIHDLQQAIQNDNFKDFSAVFVYWFNPASLYVVNPLIFHIFNPKLGYKVNFFLSFLVYCISLIKLLYNKPKPYWVYSDIDALYLTGNQCEKGYGSPDLHASLSFWYYYLIYVLFKKHKSVQKALYVFMTMINIYVLFTRTYLGEHFIHQIVLGWVYGYIYLAMFMFFDQLITEFIQGSGFQYHTKKGRAYVIKGFVATALLVSVAIIFYLLLSITPEIKWIENATNQWDSAFKVGSDVTFLQSSQVVFIFGIMLGCNITDHLRRHEKISKSWWKTELWKRFIRALLAAGLSVAILFGFKEIDCTETATEYVFEYMIPLFTAGITYTGILPYLFMHCKLANKYGVRGVSYEEAMSDMTSQYESVPSEVSST